MAKKNDVPMSESPAKFRDKWTAQDCIRELRSIAAAHPDQVISRNFFRVNASISESTWNRYFGTFNEFKRQAGVILTRHQHRMELDTAKHASVDAFRKMNIDRAGWESAYKKPSGKRFQTILTGSDIHDRLCDPFWRRLFIDTAKRVQPDVIVLNGDVFDLPEFGKYPVDPRDWDVVGRIKWVHLFLKELRDACPNAEFVLVEGNHEYRLLRHLAEASPAMRAVLSDLHGFTVPKLLGLAEFEINYIARGDLATFTVADVKKEVSKNYWIGFGAVIAHHFPEGAQMGMPGWNGHHHKFVSTPYYSPTYGNYQWNQLGSGHMRAAEYCAGERWGLGFQLVHIDTHTKHSQFEYIDIDNHCVIGGKWYVRTQSEMPHHS